MRIRMVSHPEFSSERAREQSQGVALVNINNKLQAPKGRENLLCLAPLGLSETLILYPGLRPGLSSPAPSELKTKPRLSLLQDSHLYAYIFLIIAWPNSLHLSSFGFWPSCFIKRA